MASLNLIEIEDDEDINNSALQKRRHLRKRSTSTVGNITICSNSSTTIATPHTNTLTTAASCTKNDKIPSSLTTVLERRNSVHYFLNPECRPSVSRRQRSLSPCCTGPEAYVRSDQFMAQHVTITRAVRPTTKCPTAVPHPSKENLCDKLQQKSSSSSASQPSVDIDVHVVYGSSSVISHINLNKQKLMGRKPLPTNMRGRKSAKASEKSPQKDDESNKMEADEDQHKSGISEKTSKITLGNRANRSAKILKAKDVNKANRGNLLTAKPNEQPKRRRRISGSVIKQKTTQKKTSRFTQTDNEVMQPCLSFMENRKCPIQLICPYMHSEFPCKYYYLDLVCPDDNNCQFMHNGLLTEKMKDALRSHILNQLSTSAACPLSNADCNFLQQIRDKQDLWGCLQDFQTKLRTESDNVACRPQQRKISDDAKEQLYFQYSPQQLEVYDSDMQEQLNFLTPQQLDCLCNNYKIKSRDELMHLSLGQLHEMGIVQPNEVSAIMHVALRANNGAEQQQQQHHYVHDISNVNATEIAEIIEVDDDDDDDYDARLVIDECCNEPNENFHSVSNEVSNSEIAKSPLDDLEERYKNVRETHTVMDCVEDSLQNLKNKTIPNKVRASKLMAVYEKLTRQEKILKQNLVSRAQGDTSENMTDNDNMVSTLPATLCEVVHDTSVEEDYIVLDAEDDGNIDNNSLGIPETTTEVENLQPDNMNNISEEILTGEVENLQPDNMNNISEVIFTGEVENLQPDYVNNMISEEILTEEDNINNMESEEILAPNEHLSFNSDDVGSVEVPHSDAMEIFTVEEEEVPPSYIVNDEINTSLEEEDVLEVKENETSTDSGVITTGASQFVSSPEVGHSGRIITPTDDSDVTNEQQGHESTIRLEISPEEKQIIEEFSVAAKHVDNSVDEDDSPRYENVNLSVEENTTPKSIQKCSMKSTISRNIRPRLRSDRLQENEDISSSNNSQESEVVVSSTSIKTKIFKPRRLKIPKPKELTVKSPKESDGDKHNDEVHSSLSVSQQYSETATAQKVILSNRYSKKAKAKCQSLEIDEAEDRSTAKSESQKTDNYMTDASVESLMSALYGDDGANINNSANTNKSEESNSLPSSQDPLMVADDAMAMSHPKIPVASKTRGKLPRSKVITLKVAATQPKTKRLKSRNITITKSTVRRRVSFETPTTTTTSNASSSLSSEDIISKCHHRGKPYVVLSKLKPQLLKTLQKQKENDSSTASYTSITTTCNITNSSSSTTTASFGSPRCLCDGTSHVLGQKRSCLANNNNDDDEEKDYECDLNAAHHKLMRLDSMNILAKNNMECEANNGNTVTQRITYQNDVVFEDISTTDYYSSSDEKPSEANTLQLSSSRAMDKQDLKHATTLAHGNKQQQQQLRKESDLRQQIENVCNKSDLQLLHSQQQLQEEDMVKSEPNSCCSAATAIKTTAGDTSVLPNEKSTIADTSTAFVGTEEDKQQRQHDAEQHHHNSQKDFDENQNEKAVAHPPTPPKSSNKLPYVLLRSCDETVGTQKAAADVAKNEKIHLSAAKGIVVKYGGTDVVNNNESISRIKDDIFENYKYNSVYNKLSTPHMVKRQINFENDCVNITPIASPTHVCDDIASPSPVRGGGGGLLVAAFEYQLGGEIDGRLTIPNMPYFLREIDLSGFDVNKPNNIDKLMKTSSLDPRIFRSQIKSITNVINQPQQTSTYYQTFSATPTSAAHYAAVSPYDPRNRMHHMAQQSPQPHAQNALVCYNTNPTTALPSTSAAPGVMHNFMSSPMNTPAFAQIPQQQTPNMILYECIQSSTWYHGLASSSKMQVNQSTTHLVTALNNFQRERRLNPAAVFDIFKLDSAIELLEIMNNLGIYVDTNGVINKQAQVAGYAGRSCQVLGQPCTPNPMYSFIQQVLAPTVQCAAAMPRVASMCHVGSANEPFVSCYLEPPKAAGAIPCCAHNHQQEHMPQRTEQPPSDDYNYGGDNRRTNNNNQFRKPFNQNQSQRPYNNQRFNNSNNPRFSKPSSSYSYGGGGGGGGGDTHSPTRSSSPQSFGGGGGGGRYNKRPQNSGDGASWSSSPPPASSNPFNSNRKFNRNNSFNKNSNYGNNNFSPTRSSSPNTSSGPSRYDNYQKSASPSPPPSQQDQKSPPPSSPRPDRQQSPVLNSPAKQQRKHQASTDEECWD